MIGWVKFHRSIADWEWYEDANTFRLFFHLIIKASHQDRKWRGKKIMKGTIITGRHILSESLGITEQQVRTSLNKLKSTNDITIKSNRHGSVIQVVNYEKYQEQPTGDPQSNHEVTTKQPQSNHEVTTVKECKEGNKVKKVKKVYSGFKKPSVSEVEDYLFEKYNNQEHSLLKTEADKFINYYESNGWKVGKNPMKNWKSAMVGWMHTAIKRIKKSKEYDYEAHRNDLNW